MTRPAPFWCGACRNYLFHIFKMFKVDLYNIKGEKEGKVTLPKEIFETKINKPLLSQAVRVYLANQRDARARAKTRAQVKGSNRKIYRQKGTGGARHGDNKAPIFVGGGKAHPPKGINRRLSLPKKMKQLALKSALSAKAADKQILVINDFKGLKQKTKEANKVLDKLDLKTERAILYLGEKDKKAVLAFRNIPTISLASVLTINSYQVLNGGILIFTKESLKQLSSKFNPPAGGASRIV